jgi:ankyrin repeat protein
MAAALGEIDLVRRHLDANPDSVLTRVDERSFPKRNPRSGGTIYNWVLGGNKSPHVIAHETGHADIVRLLMDRSPGNVRLIAACEIGDAELAHSLKDQLTPEDHARIGEAAERNNAGTVRLMLDCGWPVVTSHRQTPLHWAAFHGNVEMARALIEHNAPLEVLDTEHNGTPLGWAIHGSQFGWHCRTGDYPRVVKTLLDAGAARPKEISGSESVQSVLRNHP